MTDAISGETVAYQYDSLNRLISASGSGWTQTQAYDGFGNLIGRTGTGTAQSTTITTPADPTTNRLTSGYGYDANGNLLSVGYSYDFENRISYVNGGTSQYFYDAQNKRVWQGTCDPNAGSCYPGASWILSGEFISLYGVDGKLMADSNGGVRAYFGGKLVGDGFNPFQDVVQDRLGSVGKYYPYGEARGAEPANMQFATYTRDAATGNDYADQRYYSSALGRFLTMDRSASSLSLTNPGSWNRYGYVLGDPANTNDPTGLCAVVLAGINTDATDTTIEDEQISLGGIAAFPYNGLIGFGPNLQAVVSQAVLGPNLSTAVAFQALTDALNNNPGSIDVIAYSGGAQAFATALTELSAQQQARIGNILYISPGMLGTLPTPTGTANVTVVEGWNADIDPVAMIGTSIPQGVSVIKTQCDHTNLACLLSNSPQSVIYSDGQCSKQDIFLRPPPSRAKFQPPVYTVET